MSVKCLCDFFFILVELAVESSGEEELSVTVSSNN